MRPHAIATASAPAEAKAKTKRSTAPSHPKKDERVRPRAHDSERDRFCGRCGAPTAIIVPPHDHVERAACSRCGFIRYQGPRLLVLAVIFAENRMLMMRRG